MSLALRTSLFVLYSAGLMLAHLPVLRALVTHSTSDSSASHLIVIPFVALWLGFQERDRILSRVSVDWRAGCVVFAVGIGWLAAALAFSTVATLSSFVAAFVILWIGGFAFIFGRHAVVAARFPLFFLAFTIPVPAAVLDGIVRALTSGSAEVVAGLFALTGTPYYREGFVFALPTLSIEIADECSGIRSTIALGLASLVAGHMHLRRAWSRALLAAAIVPVTIVKNAIRIVTLSLLSIHVDPAFLHGSLHRDGGVMFFLLALGLLAPVLLCLRTLEARPPANRGTESVGIHPAVGAKGARPEVTEVNP